MEYIFKWFANLNLPIAFSYRLKKFTWKSLRPCRRNIAAICVISSLTLSCFIITDSMLLYSRFHHLFLGRPSTSCHQYRYLHTATSSICCNRKHHCKIYKPIRKIRKFSVVRNFRCFICNYIFNIVHSQLLL